MANGTSGTPKETPCNVTRRIILGFPGNEADWHLIAAAPEMLEALKSRIQTLTLGRQRVWGLEGTLTTRRRIATSAAYCFGDFRLMRVEAQYGKQSPIR
jgi:hypothetical protein